ncbi:hypothetical protein [Paenibacillus polymyxa]|uniref:hypothetical protein n=1 Tax=Paenibacillus polymyxa TaxID=1406 RepID=UPI000F4E5CE2|nr:hypothetical protein [Paenibacillus polymyxa]MEB4781116.1 hypothetical protein [Paenibacillus jamilae]
MSSPLRAGFDLTIAVGPGFKSIPTLLKNASYRSYLVVQKARPDIIKSGQPVKNVRELGVCLPCLQASSNRRFVTPYQDCLRLPQWQLCSAGAT